MSVEVRLLGAADHDLLEHVAADVFDHAVQPRLAREFLGDKRHHLIVAREDGVIIGMVTAVDYVHPDKAPQLWINEIGVAPTHQRRGIAKRLLQAMLAYGRSLGCTEAWLGTEEANAAARGLYDSVGGDAEAFILYSFPLTSEQEP